jgi:hypothetical protein
VKTHTHIHTHTHTNTHTNTHSGHTLSYTTVRPSGSKKTTTPKSVRGTRAVGPKVAGKANPGPEGSPTCGTHVGGDCGGGGGSSGLARNSFVFCVGSSF